MRRIAIIGYSGHAFVVLDACMKMNLQVQYYCDRSESTHNNPYSLSFLGDEGSDIFDWRSVDAFVLGIGDNVIRQRVAACIKANDKPIITVTHPSCVTSAATTIGNGCFLSSNTVVNPFAVIGENCIINTGAIIEHECRLGDTVHIGPGAVLAGNVTVGTRSFVGANAVVKQGVCIGENVIIGAGAVVINDVPDNEIWVGNPARKINK